MKNYNQMMVTLLGLMIIVFSVSNYESVLYAMIKIHRTENYGFYIPLSALYFGPLILGVYLLFSPSSLSGYLSKNKKEISSTINLSDVLITALIIMGLYISLYAFLYLFEEGIRIALYYFSPEDGLELVVSNETKAELLSYVVELVIGLTLASKATYFSSFFITQKN